MGTRPLFVLRHLLVDTISMCITFIPQVFAESSDMWHKWEGEGRAIQILGGGGGLLHNN